jgi:hypothetical protein
LEEKLRDAQVIEGVHRVATTIARVPWGARAIEDGADANVIQTRVTHTRKARNAFDGYNRDWERRCAEIAKLRITRGPQRDAVPAAFGEKPNPSN